MLNVWATWCPPCRVEEMPGFVELQEELGDDGVQFVGIAVDRGGADAVRSFVEQRGGTFPQIANPSLAARYFPGDVVPRTYIIDRQGRIRYNHEGGAAEVGASRRAADACERNGLIELTPETRKKQNVISRSP